MFSGSLQHHHSMYPRKSVTLKVNLSPCNVHGIQRGSLSLSSPVLYNIDDGKKLSLNFTNFTFEPSECEFENKT